MNGEGLRQVMRRWATGVSVVTLPGDEEVHGITVNSFTSVSLDPPLILACISRARGRTISCWRAGAFCVSVLDVNQQSVADHFAGRRARGADAVSIRPCPDPSAPRFSRARWLPGLQSRRHPRGGRPYDLHRARRGWPGPSARRPPGLLCGRLHYRRHRRGDSWMTAPTRGNPLKRSGRSERSETPVPARTRYQRIGRTVRTEATRGTETVSLAAHSVFHATGRSVDWPAHGRLLAIGPPKVGWAAW